MKKNLEGDIVFEILILPLFLIISMLFDGLRRKITARAQNRIGPPIIQPFYDILKLFQKKRSNSFANENVFFRISPILYLLSALSLFLFVPFPIFSFNFDFILIIYVTILCSGFYILSGLSSLSPYTIIGSAREMITMIAYETTLATTIFGFFVASEALSFSTYSEEFMLLRIPILSICLFLVSLIEIKITPFDTAEADTEIIEGYKTEMSGRSLAFLEIVKYIKLTFFSFLLAFLLLGKRFVIPGSLLFMFIFVISNVTTSRFRVDQAFRLYAIILFLALIDLIRVML